jgi:hypothetical protein
MGNDCNGANRLLKKQKRPLPQAFFMEGKLVVLF